MLSRYRALLTRAGARPLALACGVGWFAFTSYGLAIILVVHAATRSFAVAGAVVAAFSAGSGLAAPARGRLIDRRGPQALIVLTVMHGGAASGLVLACVLRAPSPLVLGAAAAAGIVAPPLIATARAVWSQIATPDLIGAAHAFNASLADAAQLLSPAVTGALATAFAPSVALAILVGGACLAGGVIAGIGRRVRHAQPVRRLERKRTWGIIARSSGLRTLVACDAAAGVCTGGFDVALTAVAARHGGAALAALPLSAMAIGGIAASVWAGSRSDRSPADVRYLWGALIAAAALPLTAAAPSLAGVTSIAVIAGAGYGLLGVALFELLDQVVEAGHAVEAFTWLTTAQAAGSAAGAAAAGAVVHVGVAAPFVLVGGAAVVTAAVAFRRRGTLSRSLTL